MPVNVGRDKVFEGFLQTPGRTYETRETIRQGGHATRTDRIENQNTPRRR